MLYFPRAKRRILPSLWTSAGIETMSNELVGKLRLGRGYPTQRFNAMDAVKPTHKWMGFTASRIKNACLCEVRIYYA
jgi:hypothetical protein